MCLVHTAASLSEEQSRVSALEAELCGKAEALKSIQNEMVQSKKELAVKDVSIQKARNELSVAHTRMAQESERVKAATITATKASPHKMGVGLICQNISR